MADSGDKPLCLAGEELVRDADLRAQMESKRGTFAFDTYVRHLGHLQKERDQAKEAEAAKQAQLAAMPRERRRRAVIREVFENAPPTLMDVRHIHSVAAVCGLPYERQPLEVREYERRQGQMALDVTAGSLRDGEGNKVVQPLPFGPKARLVMLHLCSEAIRQKSATIEIAETLTGFVREMGFSDSGGRKGPLTAFKEQINALAACTMRISVWDGKHARSRAVIPFDEVDVWLSSHPDQRTLWPSTVTFNDSFFESLKRHALPVNARAVKAFAGSARKLDLYFWIGYRLYNIRSPLRMSWKALGEQFGQGFSRERAFRARLVDELNQIKEVFPRLPLKIMADGICLEPAEPDVLALPAPRLIKKR